ncbi:MAG: hypothetical protein RMJ55_13405 [Roseiflexaceae bacterium]|nr:hypothetical protein [Roseiflexus sp.]MCS7289015.1 hypothetical protein [Roseiflexus sp.]MDW8148437.1 hypothetical protein [Roseiflexaceae bacterium]MDW8214550.1 hypothetical protein [Roseiflexaceae bacterium]
MCNYRYRIRLFVLVVLVAFPLAAFPANAAYAQPQPEQRQLILTVTVPLYVDCTNVPDTEAAREQLARHRLCNYGVPANSVTPDSIVRGDCGSLSLDVFNSGGGILQWKAEITSTAGPFIYASYSGDWLNIDNGRSGGVVRDTGLTFTSDWLDIIPISTGAGWVWAKITVAQSTLWYGVICRNNGPVASSARVE